jgi:hypothetical protein
MALIVGPLLAYPGNWTSSAPETSQAFSGWTNLALLVYGGLIAGTLIFVQGLRRILRFWADRAAGGTPAALGRLFQSGRNRTVFLSAAAGYVAFFGWFAGLYAVGSGGPGISMPSYPSATNVLCCGWPGYTPVAILVVAPTIEFVVYPLLLLLLLAETGLFAANVTATFAMVRTASASRRTWGSLTLGSFGALFVNCPVCGTILVWNAIAGTAAAGLLAGWAANQMPYVLAAFPLSVIALFWNGRQLGARDARAACALPTAITLAR